jgi:hypothetical protein
VRSFGGENFSQNRIIVLFRLDEQSTNTPGAVLRSPPAAKETSLAAHHYLLL